MIMLTSSGIPVYPFEYLKGYEACKVDMEKYIKSIGNGLATSETTSIGGSHEQLT